MGKNTQDHVSKRILFFSSTVLVVFILLLGKLVWIQLVKHSEYKETATKQHFKEIRVHPARGIIYDRNLIPLTNRERISTLFIFKELLEKDSYVTEYVKKITGYTYVQLKALLDSNDSIIEVSLDDDNIEDDTNKMKGLILVDKILRYEKDNILSHVIGYIKRSENIGESGIEKVYDGTLKKDSQSGVISVAVDAGKRIIPGYGITPVNISNKTDPNSVKLTIDYHIQKIAEKAMDESKRKGAVIVTEVDTGDIVAMVSRPNFDPNNILISEDGVLYNKATELGYPPGSVFKTVVLISALENNILDLDETFTCTGKEEINGVVYNCSNTEGHGDITIEEAFYDSCNSVFIQLGKRLGGEKIIETAKKLGYGSKVEINLSNEYAGNLPKGDDLLGAAIGNISIGQGEIEVTPLQITNMMMVIANNGIMKDLSIVDSIVTEEGDFVKAVRRKEEKRVIYSSITDVVKSAMEGVVEQGTASNIELSGIGGGAGKTGSAQASNTIHGWFAGYFPQDKPRYAITVFIEEGRSGGKSAAPIFEQIAKEIIGIGK